jgi:hypothetical protein
VVVLAAILFAYLLIVDLEVKRLERAEVYRAYLRSRYGSVRGSRRPPEGQGR